MATFTALPDYSVSIDLVPKVLKAQFGDGYEQRLPDGLNNMLEQWSCTFKRNTDEAKAIYNFLKVRQGVESFNWTTPDEVTKVFVCDKVARTVDECGWQTVNAVLREVPEVALP
jgi:phage-related protein